MKEEKEKIKNLSESKIPDEKNKQQGFTSEEVSKYWEERKQGKYFRISKFRLRKIINVCQKWNAKKIDCNQAMNIIWGIFTRENLKEWNKKEVVSKHRLLA